MGSRILILSPHTDDAEMGMGATIIKVMEQFHTIKHVVFSLCSENIPGGFGDDATYWEFKDANKNLSDTKVYNFRVREFGYSRQRILDKMVEINKAYDPDMVFIPCHADIHQDHKVIHQESLRAFKSSNIYGYELIWNVMDGSPSVFSVVNDTHLNGKMDMIRCYKSQAHRFYTDEEFIRSTAMMRGYQAGFYYAEAFYQYRTIWK